MVLQANSKFTNFQVWLEIKKFISSFTASSQNTVSDDSKLLLNLNDFITIGNIII